MKATFLDSWQHMEFTKMPLNTSSRELKDYAGIRAKKFYRTGIIPEGREV
jgi:hypothetical protein